MSFNADKVTQKFVAIIVFIALFVAFAPTLVVYIGNLSTTGLFLAAATSTIVGILIGVFAIKAVMKMAQ